MSPGLGLNAYSQSKLTMPRRENQKIRYENVNLTENEHAPYV
jgi:hypothetical protein